ncbi:hypothetical protein L1987_45817 [Smallanthus sonchifolius]|uniref:Uncharacterized protein n=1 Tax=Smallanthus sonchifolius TaxID=185202 RepID=A0ACB9FXU8_9ASTR|nr:hypothetical protein L1987_45817 [Smallanthus sonchifolius]
MSQQDEDYDLGIHLDDIVGHVNQAFIAEVHSEDVIDSSSFDDDSTDSGSIDEVEECIIQSDDSKFSTEELLEDNEAAWKVTEKIVELWSEANTFMADSKKVQKVVSCSKCIESDIKITRLCDDNTNLICDMKAIHTSSQTLKENENILNIRIESLKEDIKSLQIKVNDQAFHLDVAYYEYEKKINELAQSQIEERILFDDSSDEESFDSEKVEGIVKVCKVDEPVMVKRVTRDKCILTELDEVKSKVVQTSNTDIQCESSSSKGSHNERYDRVYKERRACFHCGVDGHVLRDCPDKNKGKCLENPRMGRPFVESLTRPKSGSSVVIEQEKVKLSRPHCRRRNKRLKKLLEQSVVKESGDSKEDCWQPLVCVYVAFAGKKGDNISGLGTVSNGRLSFEKVNYVV